MQAISFSIPHLIFATIFPPSNCIKFYTALHKTASTALKEFKIRWDAPHVNCNGGAISLGHPLGASGGRILANAVYQLHRQQGKLALCTMCIGVGQGIAMIIERV
ncbi:hypothetical protein GU833_10570 [Photorhabdus akhurstii]